MRRPVPVWRGQGWEELADARQSATPPESADQSAWSTPRRSSRPRGRSRSTGRSLAKQCPEQLCTWFVRLEDGSTLYLGASSAADAEMRAVAAARGQGFKGRAISVEHACLDGSKACPLQRVLPLGGPEE